MYTFIGDLHGNIDAYKKIISATNGPTIQVGDFGVGFTSIPKNLFGGQDFFIRGNHDDPDLCEIYRPSYLGNFGYFGSKIFFVSGAFSIDYEYRTMGVDWWTNEELDYRSLLAMIEAYKGSEIIVSHDCPAIVYDELNILGKRSRTALALNELLNNNPPRIWVFGHHHRSIRLKINGAMFIGLDIEETVSIL